MTTLPNAAGPNIARRGQLRWGDRIAALAGWRLRGLAMALGGLAGLGFAPLNWLPAFALGVSGLFFLAANARSRRAAFVIGWWWGFGHFAVDSYWIAESFLVDAARFGWMIPFVIGGLAAFLALYPALASLVLRAVPRPFSFAGLLLFAAAWTVAEWLRGWVLTGYPWDLAAYIWSCSDAMMQSAALWGSWGLSLMTVLTLGMPALLLNAERRRATIAIAGMIVLLGGLYAGGAWRLSQADNVNSDTMVRLVQPNIAQTLKMTGDDRPGQVGTLLRLTLETPGFEKVKAVIWPESAVDYLLEREPQLLSILTRAVPKDGVLITGDLRGEPATGPLAEIWNSMSAIDSNGRIVGTSDKFHLVPLGEYVPLREIFPFINKLTPGSMNFSPGPGPRTLHLPGLPPISPLICYEVIFPGAVVDPKDRPGLLVNITNDGWFGTSTGPSQHFATARFRAVEEGIPLLRAANTGISGVVDAYGRVQRRSAMIVEAVIDAPVPVALPATPFSRFGALALIPLLVIAVMPMLFRRRRLSDS
jgi:apolipoprotein N-acyltransferase